MMYVCIAVVMFQAVHNVAHLDQFMTLIWIPAILAKFLVHVETRDVPDTCHVVMNNVAELTCCPAQVKIIYIYIHNNNLYPLVVRHNRVISSTTYYYSAHVICSYRFYF